MHACMLRCRSKQVCMIARTPTCTIWNLLFKTCSTTKVSSKCASINLFLRLCILSQHNITLSILTNLIQTTPANLLTAGTTKTQQLTNVSAERIPCLKHKVVNKFFPRVKFILDETECVQWCHLCLRQQRRL
jgi:hypothetical protein